MTPPEAFLRWREKVLVQQQLKKTQAVRLEAELEAAGRLHRQFELVEQVEKMAAVVTRMRKSWCYTLLLIYGSSQRNQIISRSIFRWRSRALVVRALDRLQRSVIRTSALEAEMKGLRRDAGVSQRLNARLREEMGALEERGGEVEGEIGRLRGLAVEVRENE